MNIVVAVLVILLVLLCLGGLPAAPWWGAGGHPYGLWPSGGLGLVLLVVLILALLGRL